MKTLQTILILFLLTSITSATVRYVSKTGSSTPPYTTWETASDSVQKAIDVCNPGDTIYVNIGIYEEIIDLHSGITLSGVFADSCIIDFSGDIGLGNNNEYWCLSIVDSGKVNNLTFLGPENKMYGSIVSDNPIIGFSEINHCKFIECNTGIYLTSNINGADAHIHHCIFNEIKNYAIYISGMGKPFAPVIEYNVSSNSSRDIFYFALVDPIIRNNILMGGGVNGTGAINSFYFSNNLLIQKGGNVGAIVPDMPNPIYNNVAVGNYRYSAFDIAPILDQNKSTLYNNIVSGSGDGFVIPEESFGTFQYNNTYVEGNKYRYFTPDSTNMSIDPMFVSLEEEDFHLQKYSPMIDAGYPGLLDVDSTRSDLGIYGGPFGKRYEYQDYPPGRRTIGYTTDNDDIIIEWEKSTESDFDFYTLYRSENSSIDPTFDSLITITDSTSYHFSNASITDTRYYYVTATDNQGNESEPSNILMFDITGIDDDFSPKEFILHQNYPNPFNGSTTIGYNLKTEGYVRLLVYNVTGELVTSLVNGYQQAGYYEERFTPQTGATDLASGIYIYKLQVSDTNKHLLFLESKKMIHLK